MDEEAAKYFAKAVEVQPNFHSSLEGLSLSSLNKGEFEKAILYANRSLAEHHEALESKTNRGMAYLALGRWKEGWRDYNENIGIEKNRKEMTYGYEPRWDGSKGKKVVCYGEQGIGDEMSFASCLPDLIRDSKHVTIECDMRLRPLFERSFPQTVVMGTRYKDEAKRDWAHAQVFDARVAMGQLPEFYRKKDSDFHGKPYLIPNPQLALQWRALLQSMGTKPKIGIAWTGGIPKTGQAKRTVGLDTLAPLIKGFDADWISLQYKDVDGIQEAEKKHGIKIHDWEWGTRMADYDHTVALISELDLVISVCTTVVHAAGGLGKETWCLVPEVPMWRYRKEGTEFPWSSSVTLFRQKGEWPINQLLERLKTKFADPRPEHREREEAAKETA